MSYASEVLADSPILYYKLGEATTTTTADDSGVNNLDGTYAIAVLGVGPLLTEDTISRYFNGTTQFVGRAHNALMATDYIAVECVFAFAEDRAATREELVGKLATGTDSEYRLTVDATTKCLKFEVLIAGGVSGFVTANGATPLVRDRIYHAVGVFAPTFCAVYLDGTIDGSTLHSNTREKLLLDFRFGAVFPSAVLYKGWAAHVALYGSAGVPLTADRIDAHADEVNPGIIDFLDEVAADAPTGWWQFAEASGTTAVDSSGNGNTGTYAGTVTFGEASIVPGDDSGNDSISIPGGVSGGFVTLPNFDLTAKDWCYECWLRPAVVNVLMYHFQNRFAAGVQQDIHIGQNTGAGIFFNYFFNDFTAAAQMVAGNLHHVVYRRLQGADLSSIWVNGLKAAESANGPILNAAVLCRLFIDAAGGSRFNGRAQHGAIYVNAALSDARIVAHYIAGRTVFVLPPDAPDIEVPTEDQAFDRLLDITIEDVTGTGEGVAPVEYLVEHRNDPLEDWAVIIDFSTTRVYTDFYIGDFPEGDEHQLRATATKSDGGTSEPGDVRTFRVIHNTTVPDQPTVTWPSGAISSGLHASITEFDSDVEGAIPSAIDWEVAEDSDPGFASPIIELSTAPERRVVTFNDDFVTLAADTSYRIRARWVDDIGSESLWSFTERAKTCPAYSGFKIGVGDIGWSGGAVAGGVVIPDYSGNARHGRHVLVTGGDGSSFLNQGVTVHNHRRPFNVLDDTFGSTDRGTQFSDASLGRAMVWSVTEGDPDILPIARFDAEPAIPDWGLLLLIVADELPALADIRMVWLQGESKVAASPIATGPMFQLVLDADGELRLVSAGLTPAQNISTEVFLEPGVPQLLRISHKYTTEGGAASVIRINGTIIYNGTPITVTDGNDFGHFRLGSFASANIGGTIQQFQGCYSEAAFWWNEPDLDFADADDLPKVETVALSAAAIIAAQPGLALYWRMDEIGAPATPVLTFEE